MSTPGADPLALLVRRQDEYEEFMPDVVVVVIAPDPRLAPCWVWDPDWTGEPHWLRAVARLTSGIPDPVGCCCCPDTSATVVLLPGNVAKEDALARALAVCAGDGLLRGELYRLVLDKETGKPLAASSFLRSVDDVRGDPGLRWALDWARSQVGPAT